MAESFDFQKVNVAKVTAEVYEVRQQMNLMLTHLQQVCTIAAALQVKLNGIQKIAGELAPKLRTT